MKPPVRLIAMTRSYLASVVSCKGEKSSLIPATFASASILSPAVVTIASMSARRVMSPVTVTTSASGRESLKPVSRSAETSTATIDPGSSRQVAATASPSTARASPPSHRPGRAGRGPGHRRRDDPANSRRTVPGQSVRFRHHVPTPFVSVSVVAAQVISCGPGRSRAGQKLVGNCQIARFDAARARSKRCHYRMGRCPTRERPISTIRPSCDARAVAAPGVRGGVSGPGWGVRRSARCVGRASARREGKSR